jgi:uncharacterized membrane protein YfcA
MWEDVLLYVIIGFVAQMIDGAIGMAYGVTASSVLLGLGVRPATASACVHAAETFTTGASSIGALAMLTANYSCVLPCRE